MIEILATKTELKADQDKIVKLGTYDWSYYLCKMFLLMKVLKIYLIINQHLVRYRYKMTRALIIFLAGNQKVYVVSLFLCNMPNFCIL